MNYIHVKLNDIAHNEEGVQMKQNGTRFTMTEAG
jgi:hypothetical protein